MTFEEWCADNCPEFQRTQYSAGDIEANVRSVAESAWQASRRAALEELQQKALDRGFKYWRAQDAHGVTATNAQAVDLLQDLLGVEVEIGDRAENRDSDHE